MTSTTETDRLLRPREVAARLQVGLRTVYALIACKKLRAIRIGIGAGTIRIHEADFQTYVAALRGAPLPPPCERQPAGDPRGG
jgi:excisionase family DNA binding protein